MKETATDNTSMTHAIGEETPGNEKRRLFMMRAGAHLFAVYVDEVEATSENLTPTPLPFAPPPVRGVVSQRGRILTVIDPLLLFPDSLPATPVSPLTGSSAPLVVALKGDEQLALSIERLEPALDLLAAEADVADDVSSLLRRTIRHQSMEIALLNPARLFDAAMRGVDRRRRRT